MLGAVAVVFMNLVVDILYAFLDPRVRYAVSEALLDVRDLTVVFPTHEGDVRAVSDLSYTLHRGETLGIVGESGSGKTRLEPRADGPAQPSAHVPDRRGGLPRTRHPVAAVRTTCAICAARTSR